MLNWKNIFAKTLAGCVPTENRKMKEIIRSSHGLDYKATEMLNCGRNVEMRKK